MLLSLDDKQIREGLAEIIKHALIIDDGFFDWLSENIDALLKSDQEKLLKAIARSIEIKSEVVAKDETEQGVRKWLNLGHTFGHAIELYGEYRDFSHGESVALGAIMATNLSERVLNLDKKEGQKIRKLISSILTEELLNSSFDENKLLQLMSSDKKRKGNDLNFILINKIGDPQIVSSPEKLQILESIKIS